MRRKDEDGAVTAEAAMVLPVLVVVTAVMSWLVGLGVAQARAVDAARETARALARGDDAARSEEIGRRVAPDGSRFTIVMGGGEVQVEVRAKVSGPLGLFGLLPGFEAHSSAVARAEP